MPLKNTSTSKAGTTTDHLHMDSYSSILTSLQDGGYYRAGNANLSMFDKVIGGLCWCITASGANVDVDILFEENMPLGKKVTLSENVVKSLERMKCNFPLKAHQIQGLDFAALLPIIKWAVKQVETFRVENARRMREYTHHHFEKHHDWPEDFDREIAFMHEVGEKYRARRVLKRPQALWNQLETKSESELVQTCLLEFGRTVKMDMEGMEMEEADDAGSSGRDLSKKKKKSAFENKMSDMFKKEAAMEAEEQQRSAEQEKELLKVLAETMQDKEDSVDKKGVGSLVMLGADGISSATAWYEQETRLLKKTMDERQPLTKRGKEAAFSRRAAALDRRITKENIKRDAARERAAAKEAQAAALVAQVGKTSAYCARIEKEIKKLSDLEGKDEYAEDLQALRRLVLLNENLKAQEKSFKAACKRQMEKLQGNIKAIEASTDDEETSRFLEIEEMHAEVAGKYDKGKLLLANKARDIATLQRKIDEVPLRSELVQYERRFVELYDLIAAKLDETRKYFATYNCLRDQRDFLQKEASIIQSINDSFLTAMKSRAGKASFAKQCEAILEGIRKQDSVKRKQLDTLDQRTSRLGADHQKLVEKQRLYFKLVRDFQDECDKNDALQEELGGAEIGAE